MTYKLYYSPGACSLAPHIVLREAGAGFDLVKVSTKTHELEGGGDYYAINPKGYVPALGLPNGEVLTEGPAITQYLADLHPAAKLAPAAGTLERARLQEWLTYIGTELHKSFGPMFTPGASDEQKAQAREKVVSRFGFVEQALSDGRAYLQGDAFSIADAYLFVIGNWARFVGIDLGQWPNLAAFQGRVAARPAVQAAMKAEGLG
jgi:glutathione S-transferase